MAPFIGFVVFWYDPPYHMPSHRLRSAVGATSRGRNTVSKLASHFAESFWLHFSLLSPDCVF